MNALSLAPIKKFSSPLQEFNGFETPHPTTQQGLSVTAVKDTQTYPTGLKVTDDELAVLHLARASFHGEWNYTIKPHER